jgi:DNA topoisomerase-1
MGGGRIRPKIAILAKSPNNTTAVADTRQNEETTVAARKKTTQEAKPAAKAPRKAAKSVSKNGTAVTKTPRKKATATAVTKTPAKKAATTAKPPATTKKSGNRNLVIVESPAKAKTIQKYLGSGFEVRASYGHVRDLSTRQRKGQEVAGLKIEEGWVPTYVVEEERKKEGFARKRRSAKDILAELKREADRSANVYLATDPDREGEAIAWHIEDELKLDDAHTFRIAFNEITRTAVQRALANPGKINMDLVKAQEARRFLDRVVGYPLSNLLGRKVSRGLSAGRVQSVAVRLIVEREREIENFKTEEYWKVTAELTPAGTVQPAVSPVKAKIRKKAEGEEEAPGLEPHDNTFLAELAEWNGQKFKAGTEQEATGIAAALETAAYTVTKVEQKDREEKAQAPFTTSTLQQQANMRLHFSAKRTMSVAQKLYEGIDMGSEGAVALITYMRTDSTRVSDDALKACRAHIQSTYGDRYLPAQPNRYASGKSAQEAHEAIRPTDLAYTPEKVAPFLSDEQRKLYDLIYRRFVASQMTPAVFAVTNVEVTAAQGLFKAQGKILKFDGYRRALAPRGKQEDATLPPLTEHQALTLLDLLASQHFTQPPPRFNEASLVKALEKEGIGRPSTYATIIDKIQTKGYVKQEHRRFFATEMGKVVTDKLVKHFEDVMNLKFTSGMEEKLDQIESRQLEWKQVLTDFWTKFRADLDRARDEMEAVKGVETGESCPKCGKALVERFSKKTGTKFVGCSGYPDCKYIKPGEGEAEPKVTEHLCPNCGKPMIERMSRRGPFLGCSGYPDCKTTMNFDAEGKPVLAAKPTEHTCEKCGSPMVIREGRRGPFLACTGYPKCKNAKDVDVNGNPIEPIDTGVVCDKCGSPMAVRKGPRGPFLGCSAYPKCRSYKPVPAELKEKLKELMPPPAKKTPDVEVSETCPQCGAPMKLRRSRRGYFLGCSKYPKCEGTREPSPELLEQVEAT